ncbi:MAG TPA: hypothetical protein VFI84_04320 [Candidatus Saccharimonadales bacterium]|nr:hypothetical protein [Candidatus Saccharimonadales bacterium]
MKEIAEQFAAINLSELCGDDTELIDKANELDLLDCDELKKTEVELTYKHLSSELDAADQLTLQALSYVLLKKYVTKQLPLTDSLLIPRAA